MDYWAMGGDNNSVLFDTTWGTNLYKMKLGCFTAVGKDGETRILGATILLREDAPSFEWGFDALLETLKLPPRVIITDGDPAIAAAIGAAFPDTTVHILCVYHLSLNFATHIKPVFGSDPDGYKAILNAFWRLAKETDERTRESFDADFEKLLSSVWSKSGEGLSDAAQNKIDKALTWLDTLRVRKEKWAYRFTWRYLTLGANASQVRPRARAAWH
jgi:hypothetical protein